MCDSTHNLVSLSDIFYVHLPNIITLIKELAVMAYSPAILYFGLISPIIMCSIVYTIFWIHQKKTQKIIGYQEVESLQSDAILSMGAANNMTKNHNFDELFVICEEEDEYSEEEKELLNDDDFEADISMGFQKCELIVDKKYSIDNEED